LERYANVATQDQKEPNEIVATDRQSGNSHHVKVSLRVEANRQAGHFSKEGITMNPFTLVNIALQVLAAAPAFEADIKAVFAANWSHGLVNDAKQGISLFSRILADVEANLPGAVSAVNNLTGTPDPNASAANGGQQA
jgi:hypothetical protein